MKISRVKTRWIYPTSMIVEVGFPQVQKTWSEKLWPSRENLEPQSAMVYLDYSDHDMGNLTLPVHFFGLYVNGILRGTNSVHLCADGSMRSRGLWVDEDLRGQGHGKNLLQVGVDKAIEYDCPFIWSFPRKSSWHSYRSVGFELTSGWQPSETNDENAFCRLDVK